MDEGKQLSSDELERLLLRRRRQEAVEGLRSLAALPASSTEKGTGSPRPAGLALPDRSPRVPASPAVNSVVRADAVDPEAPVESWLCGPRVRLQPTQGRRQRAPRKPSPPAVVMLKKGLARLIDTLVVLVLLLFVVTLGLWLYDHYVAPRVNPGASTAQAQANSALWPSQGKLSAPSDVEPSAPLPFVPYYTNTVNLDTSSVPTPTQAPGTLMPTGLVIPAIQLEASVVEVTIENGIWQVAHYAAGYHRGTARPGTVGNTVISGHNGLYGAVFARLHELEPGDEILLYAKPRLYRYIVSEKKNVWPHQVEVMAQTSDPILTLITCTAYDTQRLVVMARLDRELATGEQAGP